MKYFKKLVGEKLYLSPVHPEDKEIFAKWLNDFKITDGIGRGSSVLNIRQEEKWMNAILEGEEAIFSIIESKEDKLIGNGSLFNVNWISRTATLGILIGEEEYRGKGYGKEALGILLDFAFNYLNLTNVMLNVFSFNEGAIKAYEAVGFKEIGRRRQSYYLNGKTYDEIYMDILKEEFKKEYILNKNR